MSRRQVEHKIYITLNAVKPSNRLNNIILVHREGRIFGCPWIVAETDNMHQSKQYHKGTGGKLECDTITGTNVQIVGTLG